MAPYTSSHTRTSAPTHQKLMFILNSAAAAACDIRHLIAPPTPSGGALHVILICFRSRRSLRRCCDTIGHQVKEHFFFFLFGRGGGVNRGPGPLRRQPAFFNGNRLDRSMTLPRLFLRFFGGCVTVSVCQTPGTTQVPSCAPDWHSQASSGPLAVLH